MYKIYGLNSSRTGKVFYVGSTKQKYVSKRKCHHVERAKEGIRTAKLYEIIRGLSYQISFVILEEFEGNQEIAWEKEQFWIDKLNPVGNTDKAKGTPPKMGGHNRLEIESDVIDKIGTMPDYKLAEQAGISKYTIARRRRNLGIKSYAEQTGNDGKIKKGEKHRRWD